MTKKKKPFQLEEAFTRLEAIVEQLEHGEESLEKSLELFEEGITLATDCRKKLEAAEQKIKTLVTKSDGTIALEDLE